MQMMYCNIMEEYFFKVKIKNPYFIGIFDGQNGNKIVILFRKEMI